MTRHPDELDLALYSSGDLNLPARARVGWHVSRCEQCRNEVEAYRAASDTAAREGAEMPRDLNWGKLSAEMKANVRLGLVAGQIAGGEEEEVPRWFSWRPAAAMGCIAVLVMSGMWLNRPAPKPRPVAETESNELVLLNTASGIEMARGGRALALTYDDAAAASVIVGAQGSMRARYINEDFEVTIHNVYAH